MRGRLSLIDHGGLFLRERREKGLGHDASYVKAIVDLEGVLSVRGDLCAYGKVDVDKLGIGLVRAPTRWLTNGYMLRRPFHASAPI